MQLIIRILINAAALWLAARYIDGISLTGSVWSILLVALVFGVVNALLRPILKILSLPVVILTLGLFTIVINAVLLGITAVLMDNFSIDGVVPALLASLVVSVVSAVLSRVADQG
jgi:putative membrane protein